MGWEELAGPTAAKAYEKIREGVLPEPWEAAVAFLASAGPAEALLLQTPSGPKAYLNYRAARSRLGEIPTRLLHSKHGIVWRRTAGPYWRRTGYWIPVPLSTLPPGQWRPVKPRSAEAALAALQYGLPTREAAEKHGLSTTAVWKALARLVRSPAAILAEAGARASFSLLAAGLAAQSHHSDPLALNKKYRLAFAAGKPQITPRG